MVDFEPKVNGPHATHSPVSGFAGRAAHVAGDFVELAELQAKLVKTDAQLALHRATKPTVMLLLGISGAVASLPVLALGCASLLANTTGVNEWQSQLMVGGGFAVLAALIVYLSVRGIRRATEPFQRSAVEFAKNLAWLKSVLGREPT